MIYLIRMKKTIYSALGLIATLPLAAHALTLSNPLGGVGVNSIQDLIAAIISFVILDIAPPIITVMFLVGAFKMLTAGSNETKFQEGRKTLTYAIIGTAVVLLAYGVTDLIKSFLGQGASGQ